MSSRGGRPRHTVTVKIAGEKHVLRSDAPPEYTRSVAAHVDQTVQALGDAQPLQPHRTAILAALVITDELFRTRAELQALREQVAARTGDLAARLERATRPEREVTEAAPAAPTAPSRPVHGEGSAGV